MSKIVKLILITGIFYSSLSFADEPNAQTLWEQATANSRNNAATVQNQVMANQANQQAIQNQQHQQLLQSLSAMEFQQRELLYYNSPIHGYHRYYGPSPGPYGTRPFPVSPSTFQAQPVITPTEPNPWLKPNPWQNTVANPHAGQKYPYGGSHPYAPVITPTIPSPPVITVSPVTPAGPIYVAPTAPPGAPVPVPQVQPQSPNSINIYK